MYLTVDSNAYSERWIRTVREEILDCILIISEGHLRWVLKEFIGYYNNRRPHQSLDQQSPIPRAEPVTTGKVERRQILGGVINDYYRVSDTTAVCLT